MAWPKNTPERRDEVLRYLREGHALSQASAKAGISYQTLVNWRKADPEFAAQVDIAEREGLAPIEAKIVETALQSDDKNLAFQASKFIVERRKPTRDDYAPANPNGLLPAFNLNVLAQLAPPIMQLDRRNPQQIIEGQVVEGPEAA